MQAFTLHAIQARSIRFVRVRDRGENSLHASWAVSKHVRTRPFKYYSGTYAWTAVPERRAETTTPVRRRVNCGTRKDSRRRAWRGAYMYMQESMFKTMLRIWRWVRHVCVLLTYMYMQESMFKTILWIWMKEKVYYIRSFSYLVHLHNTIRPCPQRLRFDEDEIQRPRKILHLTSKILHLTCWMEGPDATKDGSNG